MKEYPLDALIGTGHLTDYAPQYSPLLSSVKHADFGILFVSLRFGIILVGILFISFLIYIFKVVKYVYVRGHTMGDIEKKITIRSIAVSLVLLISLIHYTTLFKPGITQLFSAVIALPFVFTKRFQQRDRIRIRKTFKYPKKEVKFA